MRLKLLWLGLCIPIFASLAVAQTPIVTTTGGTVGQVPKFSAENGPIRRGDLLVTSSIAGHAMKGTDRSRITGAIVGKALGRLDSGTSVIGVLVSLR